MRLKIENFLGIKKADIKISPLTIIQGENAQGKSSIADAIRVAFGLPIRGMKQQDKKMWGRNNGKWKVELEVNGRTLTATLSKTPNGFSNKKILQYLLYNDIFTTMNTKDMQKFLHEIFKGQLENYKTRLTEEGCNESLIQELPADDIDKAIRTAELKRAECRPKELPPEPEDFQLKNGVWASRCPLPALEKKIKEVEEELNKKREQYGLRLLQTKEDRPENIEAEIEKIQESLKNLQNDIDSLERKKQVLKNIEGKINEIDKKIAEKNSKKDVLTELKEKLLMIGGFDLCNKCKKKVENGLLALEGKFQVVNTEKLQKELEELIEKGEEIRAEINELARKEELYQELKDREAELKKMLQEEKIISDIDFDKIAEEIDALEKRLEEGRKVRDRVLQVQAEWKKYKELKEKRKGDEELWNEWDKIHKALKKFKETNASESTEQLSEILNRQSILPEKIVLTKELRLLYGGRDYSLLSETERYRVSLVIFNALLNIYNFPFMLIDKGDVIVSPELKKQLLGDLIKISKQRPVIFIQARPKQEIIEKAKLNKNSEIVFYLVENGEVMEL